MFTCFTCEKTYISARHNNLPPVTGAVLLFLATDINLLIKLHIYTYCWVLVGKSRWNCTSAKEWAAVDMTHRNPHITAQTHSCERKYFRFMSFVSRFFFFSLKNSFAYWKTLLKFRLEGNSHRTRWEYVAIFGQSHTTLNTILLSCLGLFSCKCGWPLYS